MKKLKKISLAYTLQVFSVIMLFGYPGCSSNIKESKTGTGENDIAAKKHAAARQEVKKQQGHTTEAVQVNLASCLDFSK